MIYEKWKFTIVPTWHLAWLDTMSQVIFMWLCNFADKDWKCFPSIAKLLQVTWIKSKHTIIVKTNILLEKWLLSKTVSKKKDWSNNNNVYQLCIPDALGSATDALGVVQEMDTNYIHNNYTNTNVLGSEILPFNLDSETTNDTGRDNSALAKKVDPKDINKVLSVWNKYNAAVGYVNKGQRNSVEAMLWAYTVDEAIDYVNQAISVQWEQFAPSITTPYELRSKHIKLQQFLERRNL